MSAEKDRLLQSGDGSELRGRLAGHALRFEGRAFLVAGCCGEDGLTAPRLNGYDSIGHGVCECGAVSSCQDANDYRKRWHRQHKASLVTVR